MHSNFDEIVRNSDIGARTASRLHAITHYSGGCWTRKNKLSLFRKRIRPIYANGVIIIEDRYVFHTDQIPYRSTAATGQNVPELTQKRAQNVRWEELQGQHSLPRS